MAMEEQAKFSGGEKVEIKADSGPAVKGVVVEHTEGRVLVTQEGGAQQWFLPARLTKVQPAGGATGGTGMSQASDAKADDGGRKPR
jgi:hypothetical protein